MLESIADVSPIALWECPHGIPFTNAWEIVVMTENSTYEELHEDSSMKTRPWELHPLNVTGDIGSPSGRGTGPCLIGH